MDHSIDLCKSAAGQEIVALRVNVSGTNWEVGVVVIVFHYIVLYLISPFDVGSSVLVWMLLRETFLLILFDDGVKDLRESFRFGNCDTTSLPPAANALHQACLKSPSSSGCTRSFSRRWRGSRDGGNRHQRTVSKNNKLKKSNVKQS